MNLESQAVLGLYSTTLIVRVIGHVREPGWNSQHIALAWKYLTGTIEDREYRNLHPHEKNTKMLCFYTAQRFRCNYKATYRVMQTLKIERNCTSSWDVFSFVITRKLCARDLSNHLIFSFWECGSLCRMVQQTVGVWKDLQRTVAALSFTETRK